MFVEFIPSVARKRYGGSGGNRTRALFDEGVKKADSKGLKTLALCWEFEKRAFSVSGIFRKMLSDLVKDFERKLVQVDLHGSIVEGEKFHYFGIMSATKLSLNEDIWFTRLDSNLAASILEFLCPTYRYGCF